MNFKSSISSAKWITTVADVAKGVTAQDADTNLQLLTQLLTSILLSENLAVLSGLGTSMCVKDPATGTMLSPTMLDLWNQTKAKTPNFGDILKVVKYPIGSNEDIELLLSHCQLGNWERIFGGYLRVHLPPAEYDVLVPEFNSLFDQLRSGKSP